MKSQVTADEMDAAINVLDANLRDIRRFVNELRNQAVIVEENVAAEALVSMADTISDAADDLIFPAINELKERFDEAATDETAELRADYHASIL